ncbi:hypothetical protein [Chloroflexus aurantiacus]
MSYITIALVIYFRLNCNVYVNEQFTIEVDTYDNRDRLLQSLHLPALRQNYNAGFANFPLGIFSTLW